jgi:hypothetical protein
MHDVGKAQTRELTHTEIAVEGEEDGEAVRPEAPRCLSHGEEDGELPREWRVGDAGVETTPAAEAKSTLTKRVAQRRKTEDQATESVHGCCVGATHCELVVEEVCEELVDASGWEGGKLLEGQSSVKEEGAEVGIVSTHGSRPQGSNP